MKKVRLIEDDYPLVKSHVKGNELRDYPAGITNRVTDEWFWKGRVVAKSIDDAHNLLKRYIREKIALFNADAHETHVVNTGSQKSDRPHGVYDN